MGEEELQYIVELKDLGQEGRGSVAVEKGGEVEVEKTTQECRLVPWTHTVHVTAYEVMFSRFD